MQNVNKDIKRKYYFGFLGLGGRVLLKIIIRAEAGFMLSSGAL
jgi:hypothetical protein